MTAFVIVAALLTAAAVGIVLRALRPHAPHAAADAAQANRDAIVEQMQQLDADLAAGTLDAQAHARTRDELARRLLDEAHAEAPAAPAAMRGTGWALVLAVPLLAAGLYVALGNPAALAPGATTTDASTTEHDMEALVAKLAERMRQQPPGRVEDVQGWVMLGRSYAMLQRFPEAADAFAHALALAPDDAQILADQADVTAMLPGESLQGKALQLVEQALRIDPAQPKALALAGSAAFEREDFAAALGYWERARAATPPDSEFARGLERAISEARALAGAAGPASRAGGGAAAPKAETAGPAARGDAPAATPAQIRGRVSLAPALAARVAPDDTVFVFVRAATGPRAPLAILRQPASALPFEFTLDDTQAMAPQLKLSGFPEVVVGARVSRSGNATPASGDLEGEAGPMPNRARDLALTIDRIRP